MGLFDKKYDYEKDSLFIGFNLETEKYEMMMYHKYFLKEKELNRRTKKKLKEENKKLEDKELFNKVLEKAKAEKAYEDKIEARRNKLKELGYESEAFEILSAVRGSVSQSLYDYLLPILKEENVLIGIHRTGYATLEDIEKIFEEGFFMSGHGFNVIQTGGVPLYENFSYYEDNMKILDQLIYARGYNDSKGSILIRIPDDELKDENIFEEERHIIKLPVTENGKTVMEDGKPKMRDVEQILRHLKTEYILGFVPVDNNFHIEKIILNPNYGKKKTTEVEKAKEVLAEEILSNKETKEENNQDIKTRR